MTDATYNREVSDALCRDNLFLFVRGAFRALSPGKSSFDAKHMQVLCYALEQTLNNPGEHLLITMPPRYAKSFIISVCLPAWMMGKNPSLSFLVASYSEDLATEHGDLFKTLVETPGYKRVFPARRIKPNRTRSHDIQTTAHGRRKAIYAGGPATGFGADIIIIDDIIKAADAHSNIERQRKKEFFDQTLFSRLNDKKSGHIIANQQRFHEDDPAAYLLTKNFKHLCLRAIAEEDESWDLYHGKKWLRKRGEALYPELEDLSALEAIRKNITPSVFSTQYQQNPVNPGGNQISWSKISFFSEILPRDQYIHVIQSWDTANTDSPDSDYSACVTAGKTKAGKWHVLDVYRARHDYADLKRKVISMINVWRPDRVLIEKSSTGYALIPELNEQFHTPRSGLQSMGIVAMPCIDSKEDRFAIRKHYLEEGRVLFPEHTEWLSDLRHELLAFPEGRHDDQVDALFQIFQFLEYPGGKRLERQDPRTGRMRSPHRRVRR